jgi:hypothetical protein
MKTKKILIISIVMLFSTINITYAQDGREGLSFGVKLGLNASNIYDTQDDALQSDSKIGFAAGAFLAIPLGKYIGIQPEILLSQRGFKGNGSVLGSTYELTRTTNYLDIPLLFAIKPIGFLTILAGPQYSYLLKQTDKFENSTISFEQEQEFENDDIRKNILCFTGGIDINLKQLVLSARAGWDMQRNRGDGSSTTPRYRNVWYQATVGYRFYNQ